MNKQEVMDNVSMTENETGYPDVQVAMLTAHNKELK